MPEKNTLIAIALSAAVLVGWMFIQAALFPPASPTPSPAPAETAALEPLPPASPEILSVSALGAENTLPEGEALSEETYTITTKRVKAIFTNRGGDIISYELLDHRDGGAAGGISSGVQMADNITAANRAFSLSFGSAARPIISELFSASVNGPYEISFRRNFALASGTGTKTFTLTKRYTFKNDDYLFRLDVEVAVPDGTGLVFDNAAYTLRSSPQIGPHWDAKKDRYERRTFMAWNGSKRKNESVKTGAQKTRSDNAEWAGITGKYFNALVVPVQKTGEAAPFLGITYSMALGPENYPDSQLFFPRSAISGLGAVGTYYVYMGPVTENTLKIYNRAADNSWGLSGLRLNESIQSTGFLSFLETFLKWGMEIFYKLIPNWGVAIIIMTAIIKVILFPLTKKSSMASKKMTLVQPKMQELQAKYKDTPQKLNEEMAKLYKEYGVNPMSGCLPLLIQFPIIIAMFNLFNNYFEFRGASFIPGWIPDLSVGDSLYVFSFSIPFLGNTLRLLPIVYVASQLLFGKLTPTAAGGSAAQMKIMLYGMPLFFFFVFYNAPSGLLLYWTVSNILQLAQQLVINRMMARVEATAPAAPQIFKPKKKR